MSGSSECQSGTVTSGEGNRDSFDPAHLSPLERATIYPGECCVCRCVIPMSLIRCDAHEVEYQRARQGDAFVEGL